MEENSGAKGGGDAARVQARGEFKKEYLVEKEMLGRYLAGLEGGGDGDNEVGAGDERNEAPGGKAGKKELFTTPRRQINLPPFREEVSPTDSGFEIGSVFDEPVGGEGREFEEGKDGYAPTEASSITDDDDHDHDDQGGEKARPTLLSSPIVEAPAPSHSIEHEHDHIPSTNNPPTTASSSEPSPPRSTTRIWLTSCLQCVLANLPCSRDLPSCTRCARNGQADSCLVQRKRFHEEIVTDRCGVDPVLVRLAEDDEMGWERKRGLQGELLKKWREEYERKFWYPTLEKLDWRVRHPGDGLGRMAVWKVERY